MNRRNQGKKDGRWVDWERAVRRPRCYLKYVVGGEGAGEDTAGAVASPCGRQRHPGRLLVASSQVASCRTLGLFRKSPFISSLARAGFERVGAPCSGIFSPTAELRILSQKTELPNQSPLEGDVSFFILLLARSMDHFMLRQVRMTCKTYWGRRRTVVRQWRLAGGVAM